MLEAPQLLDYILTYMCSHTRTPLGRTTSQLQQSISKHRPVRLERTRALPESEWDDLADSDVGSRWQAVASTNLKIMNAKL